MKRREFMSELEKLLSNISYEDRRDALDYYENYFADAGVENEESVIRELGSPVKVAQNIKGSLEREKESAYQEYSESGYKDIRYEDKEQVGYSEEYTERNNKILKIILLLVILILGWPVLLAGLAVAGSVILAIISCVVAFLITGVVLLGAGVLVFFIGIGLLLVSPQTTMFFCGCGILLSVVGLLLTMLMIKCIQVFVPPLCRGMVNLIRKPFTRKVAM